MLSHCDLAIAFKAIHDVAQSLGFDSVHDYNFNCQYHSKEVKRRIAELKEVA